LVEVLMALAQPLLELQLHLPWVRRPSSIRERVLERGLDQQLKFVVGDRHVPIKEQHAAHTVLPSCGKGSV
jgi:hypothetical protein